jgi:hypothetical protein
MMVALSGVAQAAPISTKADAQCAKLAIQTLGSSFNPSNYTFHGGTEANDTFTDDDATAGPDVFCGFGGDDVIRRLDAGDVFLGGEGDDFVGTDAGDPLSSNYGTFYGGPGDDFVLDVNESTFNGGEGDDRVTDNRGTFVGGEGNDTVVTGNPPTDG